MLVSGTEQTELHSGTRFISAEKMEDRAMQRKRIKHTTTFEQRLAEEARRFKEAAEKEAPGSAACELLLRRARQAETASHMNDWLTSPGLQRPKTDMQREN